MIAAVKAVARMAGAAGIAIREERLRRGLTLRVVADRAGVSAATIHAMESGEGASLHTYARVVTALGL